MKRTTDNEDGNVEHNNEDDYRDGWIPTARRGPGVVLGRAHPEGEERRRI